MQKWKWCVLGIEMPEDIEIEMDGSDKEDSHRRTIEYLKQNGIDWDTIVQL